MNLADVMDEIAHVLQQITGLRVYPYPPESVTPPSGYVSYPEVIAYDETYGRGEDNFTGIPITLLSEDVTRRSARDLVALWTAGDGPRSVKAAMDGHSWSTCDYVQVIECSFDIEPVGGVNYLAVTFKATVVGKGGDCL